MGHPFRGQGTLLLLLPPFLLAVPAGLAAGPAWGAAAGLLLLASLAAATFRASVPVQVFCLMALCGLLAAGRIPLADPAAVSPLLGSEVVLRAKVEEARPADDGLKGLASEAVVSTMDGSATVSLSRVRFSVRGWTEPVSFPSGIRATGRLRPVRSLGNPGEFPAELSAMAQGVQYAFFTDASRTLVLPGDAGSGKGVMGPFHRARETIGRWLVRHAGRSDGALFLLSLTTGEVPPPSHPMVVLLRKTGLSHLLAISGVNVAVFFAAGAFLGRIALWIPRRRHGTPDLGRLTALLSLPACWAYVLMAGAPSSAVRSAGMITAAVLMYIRLGFRNAGAAWTLLFCGSILAAPFQILSPSFLLSYGASFFLILAGAGRGEGPPPGAAAARARRRAGQALGAASAAFLGTLPVSAAFFGHLPLGAVLWNLLFGPFLGAAGVAGAFAAAAGGILSLDVLGPPVRLAAGFLSGTLGVLARLSGDGWGYLVLPPAGLAAPAAATIAAAAGAVALAGRGRGPFLALGAANAAFLVWVHLPYAALPVDRLVVTALNAGKGAAHVVSFPGGGHMVIDCGSGLSGTGGRVLAPYLRSRGIRRIDVIVLTHPHEDHYGGAAALIGGFDVGEIWIPEGIDPGRFGPAVAAGGVPVRAKSAGEGRRAGGAEVRVRSVGRAGGNEGGLVLLIRYGRTEVWLPGDAERGPAAWGSLPSGHSRERVLFLPHHGAAGADPDGWVRAARPGAVVSQKCDCDTGQNLLPSVRYLCLENGALTISSDGQRVSFEAARGFQALRFLWRLPM